jgi:hypothetical protein
MQPPVMNKTGYYRDLTDQELKKRELMGKFDDIPIRDLNKAEGYQQNNKEDLPIDEEADESTLTIYQKLDHPQWKVRVKAYKDISEQFKYENQRKLHNHNFDQNPLNGSEEDEQEVNPFE